MVYIGRAYYTCSHEACDYTVMCDQGWAAAGKCKKHGDTLRPNTAMNDRVSRPVQNAVEKNWSEGRKLYQLQPDHPDYMVGSQREMERAMVRNGIDPDTGDYTSDKARNEASKPQPKTQLKEHRARQQRATAHAKEVAKRPPTKK